MTNQDSTRPLIEEEVEEFFWLCANKMTSALKKILQEVREDEQILALPGEFGNGMRAGLKLVHDILDATEFPPPAPETTEEEMTEYVFVPTEELGSYDDDGTIVDNVASLAQSVVGRRIVKVEDQVQIKKVGWRSYEDTGLAITLDDGTLVHLANSSDCCAYTELQGFLLNADRIDHIITGVSTEDGYHKWHIFADAGDVLELNVGWSCGNPFYYGYGFDITVVEATQ